MLIFQNFHEMLILFFRMAPRKGATKRAETNGEVENSVEENKDVSPPKKKKMQTKAEEPVSHRFPRAAKNKKAVEAEPVKTAPKKAATKKSVKKTSSAESQENDEENDAVQDSEEPAKPAPKKTTAKKTSKKTANAEPLENDEEIDAAQDSEESAKPTTKKAAGKKESKNLKKTNSAESQEIEEANEAGQESDEAPPKADKKIKPTGTISTPNIKLSNLFCVKITLFFKRKYVCKNFSRHVLNFLSNFTGRT